ncbi:MAG: hypothetical protein BVN32_13825 [Proteobacteria bacterium ST_bin14]|nr:MAG: hypothetical protein BVN32_13825 [Proteobacteria bacterium ST_bin14]
MPYCAEWRVVRLRWAWRLRHIGTEIALHRSTKGCYAGFEAFLIGMLDLDGWWYSGGTGDGMSRKVTDATAGHGIG